MRSSLIAIALLLCAGCSNPAPSQEGASSGPPARIDEAALARSHPFAPVVAQLDEDIRTLQASRRVALSDAGDAIAAGQKAMSAQLRTAAAQARGSEIAAPPRTNAPPTAATVPVDTALARYRSALQTRMDRAIVLRKQQLAEKELTIAYQFDRAHAGTRLHLQLRLHTLHLDAQQRKAIEAQLTTLDSQDNAAVAMQRREDRKVLAQYRASLAADSSNQLASLQRDLQAHAAAARSILQPDNAVVARAEAVPSKADATRTAAAFAQANVELSSQFAQLRARHEQASSAVGEEVAMLQGERRRLAGEIRLQIEAEARSIARSRGLGKVYVGTSPPGATDITGAVQAAMNAIRG